MTWRDIAVRFPEFVQWIVATHGPLHDGPVTKNDYERLRAEYEARETTS